MVRGPEKRLAVLLLVLAACGGSVRARPPSGGGGSGGSAGAESQGGDGGGGSGGKGGSGGHSCEPPPTDSCVAATCGTDACRTELPIPSGDGVPGIPAAAPVPGRNEVYVVLPQTLGDGSVRTQLFRVAEDGTVQNSADVTDTAGTGTPSLARAGSQVILAGNGPDGPLLGLVQSGGVVPATAFESPDPSMADTFRTLAPTPDGKEVVLAATRASPGTALAWIGADGSSETGFISVPDTFEEFALGTTTAGAVLVGKVQDPDTGLDRLDLRSVHRGSLEGSTRHPLVEARPGESYGAAAVAAVPGGFLVAAQHLPSGAVELLQLDPSARVAARLTLRRTSDPGSRVLRLVAAACSLWVMTETPQGLLAYRLDVAADLSGLSDPVMPAAGLTTALPWAEELEGTLRLLRVGGDSGGLVLDVARGCGQG